MNSAYEHARAFLSEYRALQKDAGVKDLNQRVVDYINQSMPDFAESYKAKVGYINVEFNHPNRVLRMIADEDKKLEILITTREDKKLEAKIRADRAYYVQEVVRCVKELRRSTLSLLFVVMVVMVENKELQSGIGDAYGQIRGFYDKFSPKPRLKPGSLPPPNPPRDVVATLKRFLSVDHSSGPV